MNTTRLSNGKQGTHFAGYVVYTNEYLLTLPMVGKGQMSRLNASYSPITHVPACLLC